MCDGFTSEDSAAVWAEMEMNLCWCKVHVQYDSHTFFVSILWGCVGTNRHTKNHHLPKEDVPLLKSYSGCIWIRKLLDMVRAWYLLDVWKTTAFLRVPCGSLRSHLSVMLDEQSENLIVAFHRNLLNIFATGFIQDFLMWNNFSLSTISENKADYGLVFTDYSQSLWWFLLCFTLKSHLFGSQFGVWLLCVPGF